MPHRCGQDKTIAPGRARTTLGWRSLAANRPPAHHKHPSTVPRTALVAGGAKPRRCPWQPHGSGTSAGRPTQQMPNDSGSIARRVAVAAARQAKPTPNAGPARVHHAPAPVPASRGDGALASHQAGAPSGRHARQRAPFGCSQPSGPWSRLLLDRVSHAAGRSALRRSPSRSFGRVSHAAGRSALRRSPSRSSGRVSHAAGRSALRRSRSSGRPGRGAARWSRGSSPGRGSSAPR